MCTDNGEFGSTPLPTIFGKVLNISSQGVRATATARVATGNATNCMRPFAVADNWIDDMTRACPNKFNDGKQGGNVVELNPTDVYVPPSADRRLRLTRAGRCRQRSHAEDADNPNSDTGHDRRRDGLLPVRLPDGNGGYVSGANDFSDAIKNCIGNPVAIGDYLPTENGVDGRADEAGRRDRPDSLINQDPDADWEHTTQIARTAVRRACAPFSPRIVPIAVFDIDEFQWRRTAGTTGHRPGYRGVRIREPVRSLPDGGNASV